MAAATARVLGRYCHPAMAVLDIAPLTPSSGAVVRDISLSNPESKAMLEMPYLHTANNPKCIAGCSDNLARRPSGTTSVYSITPCGTTADSAALVNA